MVRELWLNANDPLVIDLHGRRVHFQAVPHPNAHAMAHAMHNQNTNTRVHHLQEIGLRGDEYALKVLGKELRTPIIAKVCNFLDSLRDISGLACCDRICLDRDIAPEAIKQYPELEFSILLPWVNGTTWFDAHMRHPKTSDLTRWECLHLATQLAEVMAALERRELSHGKLSPKKIVIGSGKVLGVELLDLEEIYSPDLPTRPSNSMPEYRHKAENTVDQFSDRFPGALLLAEVLSWHEEGIKVYFKEQSDSLFTPNELHDPKNTQFQLICDALESHHMELARLFRLAWCSERPEQAPTLHEWMVALDRVSRTKIEYVWMRQPSRPPRNRIPRCWDFT